MDANPYAPPTAVVADPEPTGLKRRSVLLMIVLVILTLGLYIPLWFLRRRKALNQLDSPRKLDLGPFVAFAVFTALEVAMILAVRAAGEAAIPPDVIVIVSLARFVLGIVLLLQCFKTKNILEDHLAGPADAAPSMFAAAERVKLSGLMTFLFQIFYLQYVINRHIAGTSGRLSPLEA